jgi:hypothetical protein
LHGNEWCTLIWQPWKEIPFSAPMVSLVPVKVKSFFSFLGYMVVLRLFCMFESMQDVVVPVEPSPNMLENMGV